MAHRTIGIIGGGQLGRMLTLAAKPLGFHVVVVDPVPNSPAAQVGADQIVADLYDKAALAQLAERADVITIEIEHLDAEALADIEKLGVPVHPAPATVRIIQDKLWQKHLLHEAGIPVASFVEVNTLEEAKSVLKAFGGKMLLKTRHGAYDGRGNALITRQQQLKKAFERFKDAKLYAEKFIPFDKELSVIIARSTKGKVEVYPVVETVHKDNICVETKVPAHIDKKAAKKAEKLAYEVAKYLRGAGVFAIEMFLTKDGQVLVNEIAPRVHNSGHYTIEASHTSQFEQHIRAVSGLALGDASLAVPAAVMINILGERDGPTKVEGLEDALALPHVSVHIYGKAPTKKSRKMGHITATGKTVRQAARHAKRARRKIKI